MTVVDCPSETCPQTLTLFPTRVIAVLTLAVLTGNGCLRDNWFNNAKATEFGQKSLVYAIALHRFADPNVVSGNLTRDLNTGSGGTVRIRSIPLVPARCFERISVGRGPDGNPALQVQLDAHGRLIWMQICAEMPTQRVAVVVGGTYRFTFVIPRRPTGSNRFLIPGPWEPDEAEAIARFAEKNYDILNYRR